MENYALIVAALFIGYSIKQLKALPEDAPNILNKFVIYISLPSMILLEIPKLTLSLDSMIPVIVAWIVMIMAVIAVLIFSKLFNFSKEITGALLLVSVLGNTTFVGIPLVGAYLGESSLPYVIMYDQLGSFIFLIIFGTFVASHYSATTELNLPMLVKKVLLFPPTISLILAISLGNIEYNPALTSVLSSFAKTIVPIALVAVGLQLEFKMPSHDIKPFSVAIFIKLIFSPFIAYLVTLIFSWDNEAGTVSILEAGMGPMITAAAMASMSGLAPRLSSALVGYGIILSFATTAFLYNFII